MFSLKLHGLKVQLQYWAVADMEDGSVEKVISFSLDRKIIEEVKSEKIPGNKIIDNAYDTWILPSLLE